MSCVLPRGGTKGDVPSKYSGFLKSRLWALHGNKFMTEEGLRLPQYSERIGAPETIIGLLTVLRHYLVIIRVLIVATLVSLRRLALKEGEVGTGGMIYPLA